MLMLRAYGALSMQSIQVDVRDPAGVFDAEIAQWWQHNLQRVPLSNSRRIVTVEPIKADGLAITPEAKQVPLVVLAKPVSSDVASRLTDYVRAGGRLLIVLAEQTDSAGLIASLNEIAGAEATLVGHNVAAN